MKIPQAKKEISGERLLAHALKKRKLRLELVGRKKPVKLTPVHKNIFERIEWIDGEEEGFPLIQMKATVPSLDEAFLEALRQDGWTEVPTLSPEPAFG